MIVTVHHFRFHSAVRTPTRGVSDLVKRIVPARAREYDPLSRVWIIYGSQIEALITALRARGIEVEATSSSNGGRA